MLLAGDPSESISGRAYRCGWRRTEAIIDWLFSPFTVLPIQMFNWLSRPQSAFHVNAAATGIVIIVATLAMNGIAIWLRSRIRAKLKW